MRKKPLHEQKLFAKLLGEKENSMSLLSKTKKRIMQHLYSINQERNSKLAPKADCLFAYAGRMGYKHKLHR